MSDRCDYIVVGAGSAGAKRPDLQVHLIAEQAADMIRADRAVLPPPQVALDMMAEEHVMVTFDTLRLNKSDMARRLILLLQRVSSTGVGVLRIEQYTEMALDVAQDVALLTRGTLLAQDSAAAFKGNPDKIRDLHLETTE